MSTNNVKDSAALEQLRSTFTRNSECMENALNSFDGYLNETVCSMNENIRVIAERLKEAQAELSEAQGAYDSCKASQRYDEETGETRPSCFVQSMKLASARTKYLSCKKDYDDANKILQECKQEINEYNQNAKGILTEMSSKSHNASSRLDEILEKVDCYAALGVGYSIKGSGISSQGAIKETPTTVPYSIKNANGKKEINKWRYEQASEKLKNKNLCPKHNRPLPCPFCMKDALDDGTKGSGLGIDTEKKTPEIKKNSSPFSINDFLLKNGGRER